VAKALDAAGAAEREASAAAPVAVEGAVWPLALERQPEVQGALVSLEPETGEVRALVGGYSFEASQFNRATQARRQPGSAFKPIVYSAALDSGMTPSTVLLDAPIVYTDTVTDRVWKPENFEGVFYGPTLLRTALCKSRNLVTIRVAQRIGIRKIIERAKALGLEAEFPEDLSVSLGSAPVSPLNLARAYTAFARGGSWIEPRFILRVESAWGEELFRSEPRVHEAVSPQTAYIITALMKEVVNDGTGWRARKLGRPVAGKTGTSNAEQDAWFVGFTPNLLTVVWVGFDQLTPMGKYETGARAASPIWVDYRMAVEAGYPERDFPLPQGVVMARIDPASGLLASPYADKTFFLPFKDGTQPTETAQGDDSGAPGPSATTRGEDLLKQ
jgi:penicillin-binding protein 1A